MEETIPMYNSITIIGNLGRDPEIRETQKGSQFATLSVATNRMVQGERETDWHKVVVWIPKLPKCYKSIPIRAARFCCEED